jgi:DNA-binding NarL/FixJ family response regulator
MAAKITRIAIVEDDAHLRELFAGWVRGAKQLTLADVFADAETAVTGLRETPADIVLMDINLPGQNGIECVRNLKPLLPKTQFLMVTVYEDTDRIFSALAAGAAGYLLKRATRMELFAAIDELLAGGSPMSSSIARKVVQSFQLPLHKPSPTTESLSDREGQVLELLAQGYIYKEIGEQMAISIPTVGTHVRHIYEKLHVRSRAQAVAKFRAGGNP